MFYLSSFRTEQLHCLLQLRMAIMKWWRSFWIKVHLLTLLIRYSFSITQNHEFWMKWPTEEKRFLVISFSLELSLIFTHVLSFIFQDGYTPLFIAAQNGHYEVVKILLDKGASVDLATKVFLFNHTISWILNEMSNWREEISRYSLFSRIIIDFPSCFVFHLSDGSNFIVYGSSEWPLWSGEDPFA